MSEHPPARLLIDGFNVLGSRPDGWWKDRPAAMRRLVAELRRRFSEAGPPVTVVFDGRPHRAVADSAGDNVTVEFAPGGPDAADRVIATLVREAERPEEILVASSDRRLRASVKAAGGRSISAGEFIAAYLAGGEDGGAR